MVWLYRRLWYVTVPAWLLFISCASELPQTRLPSRGKPFPKILEIKFVQLIGRPGARAGEFTSPQGICTDLEGNLYVADTGNDRIQKFGTNGVYQGQTGGFGWDQGQFNKPTDLYVNNNIEVWVVDSRNERIQQFDTRLNYLATFKLEDFLKPDVQFGLLHGIGVSTAGDIFITDRENEKVYQFNPFGALHRTLGEFGYGEGYIQEPASVAFDRGGNLYVCDMAENRVAIFDQFGNFLHGFGKKELSGPRGVAVDRWGYCFVADTRNHRLAVFDPEGNLAFSIGARGKGTISFIEPQDAALAGDEFLYVSDQGNGRVQKFRIVRESK